MYVSQLTARRLPNLIAYTTHGKFLLLNLHSNPSETSYVRQQQLQRWKNEFTTKSGPEHECSPHSWHTLVSRSALDVSSTATPFEGPIQLQSRALYTLAGVSAQLLRISVAIMTTRHLSDWQFLAVLALHCRCHSAAASILELKRQPTHLCQLQQQQQSEQLQR